MSQQEMPMVYPISSTVPPSNNSPSGSYGSVFIVLAIIVFVSAIACFLGRLCNKRHGHDEARPYKESHPPKNKDATRNANAFPPKDGDIEFGYDKRFASAKVAATGEPTTTRPNPFGDPNTGRQNSFNEPNVGRSNSYDEPGKVRPNSFPEPVMGRPSSFHEPTMGRPDSFRKTEFHGDQVKFAPDRGPEINFKPRTRAQRY